MRFPLHIATDMMRWQLKNWWAGNQHVPVVLGTAAAKVALGATGALAVEMESGRRSFKSPV